MRDDPPAPDILAAAIAHLRQAVLPALVGRAAFDLRVCLSALDLVAREIATSADDRELAALRTLVGADGDLETLNHVLADRLEAGEFDAGTPGLIDHLYRTTMAKLAIDQPGYAGYRRHLSAEVHNP